LSDVGDVDSIERAVVDALSASGHDFEVLECDPDFADTAAFCERYGIAPEDSANAIVVVGKAEPRRYVCCVVLATTRLDVNGIVRRRLGVKKASFASADETRELTGMLIGGVTPVALPPDVPVWVDARVLSRDRVVIGGGSRSMKILVAPTIFEALPNCEIVPDLATTPPPPP
jgi:prolyl-tRNA editing enzyme YbaK/EbsC (Cys-tRNA(Pro) deacylase)